MGGFLNSLGRVAEDVAIKAKPLFGDFIDRTLKSGWSSLDDLGPMGKYISNTARLQRTVEANYTGQAVSAIADAWEPVSKVTRLAVKNNPQVAPQASAQMQSLVNQTMTELANRGVTINVGGFKVPISAPPNFFPSVLKDEATTPGLMQKELVDHLLSSGQVANRAAGEEAVSKLRGQMYGRNGVKTMFDLNGLQVPDKFLELDPKVAYSVWSQAASRYITKFDAFGPKDVNLAAAVNALGATQGTNAKNFAMDAINLNEYGYSHSVGNGHYYDGIKPWEVTLRQYEGLTKLSRVSIPHATQSLNALLLADASTFLKGLADVSTNYKDAINFSIKSGALIAETMRDYREGANGKSWLSTMMSVTGFNAERKFNIAISANTGKHYAMELADNLVANPADKESNFMLRKLGLEPSAILRQGGLSQNDIFLAARRFTELTQFLRSPLDTPISWSKNPWTRTFTMYKNFVFNQAKFMKDAVFDDAMKGGKYQNIAYISLLFPAVAELIGNTESFVQGHGFGSENRVEDNPLAKTGMNKNVIHYLDNLSRIGAIGMYTSMLASFNRNNITHWAAGPAVGDIDEVVRVANQLIKNKDTKPLKKSLVKKIPVVGTGTGNTIYGAK
jgi:hypothetical protein